MERLIGGAYFFGYGSLVNRKTHAFERTSPAKLHGWRRMWRHTALRPVAFLTVVPVAGADIDGLIAHVPFDDWAALDAREHAYDRLRATEAVTHEAAGVEEIAVYTIPAGKHGPPDATHPVLLSYLDVVVQGYLDVFGPEGVARFFDTTDGWDAPILDDRAQPIYPRAQPLTGRERGLVDAHLRALGAEVRRAD